MGLIMVFLLSGHRRSASCGLTTEIMDKLDLLPGSLDLLVLHTLATMGPMHGYGIARRIEQVGSNALVLNQGTIYAALVRLLQGKWISAEWGTSDNNRKARYYSITARGRERLTDEKASWQRMADVVQRILSAAI
jgi:PadR family transcriptional regulator PadR